MSIVKVFNKLRMEVLESSLFNGPSAKVQKSLTEEGWSFKTKLIPVPSNRGFLSNNVTHTTITSPNGKAVDSDRETHNQFKNARNKVYGL